MELEDVVRDAGDSGVTAQEAAQRVLHASGGAEKKKIERALDKLVKAGKVEKVTGIRTARGAEPSRYRYKPEYHWAENVSASNA